MRFKNLFMGILAAAAFTACSSDDIMQDEPKLPEDELNTRFMTVSIRNTEGMSRAGEDDPTFENGSGKENDVKSIRFYFFDKDGQPYKISYTGKNFYDCEEIEDDATNDNGSNVEKTLQAVIVLSSDNDAEDWSGIDKMIAVANFDKLGLGDINLALGALKSKVGDYGFGYDLQPAADDVFVMTSSAYAPESGNASDYGCEVKVDKSKISDTREGAQANPVEIYVERVVAKVRTKASWKNMGEKNVEYNGETYTAIPLKDKADGDKITDSTGKQIYVIFTGWDLSGYTDKSYLFKQVDQAWNLGSWNTWNNPTFHRSYWAMNPEGVKYMRHKHADAMARFGSDALYCQENAADYYAGNAGEGAGTKRIYSPDAETGNRTQAYFKAVLVTLDGDVATPVELAVWGDMKYTSANLTTAMLNSIGDVLYYTVDADATGTYTKLGVSDVELVHAENAVSSINEDGSVVYKADNKTEASRRYLTYIQLKPEFTAGKKLYIRNAGENGKANYTEISTNQANEILSNMPGARCWKGGDTYYYVDIQHLGKDADKGKFGVVRNHIYEIELNSVYGLGTPVYTPDSDVPEIIPQKPSNEAFYLGARLNILSWRVVKQGVSLDW